MDGGEAVANEDRGFEGTAGEELRLPKLSHLVASRLRDQIISGKLKPGSQLMPESKMLELFKVSRPTLREALRILEAESLIAIGRGVRHGATVLGPNIQKAAEYTTFMLVSDGVTMRDLHEARMFFEPAIVRSLCGEKLSEATSELRGCVDQMKMALSERRFLDVVAGTNRFHETLARVSGNKTIALLVGMLQLISDDAYSVVISSNSSSASDALQKNMAKTASGYSALCDLLEKGKTDEAASFWRRYMERALEFLSRSKLGDRKLVQNSNGFGASAERALR